MPSALRRPLALSVCTAANDRGTLVWENPGEQKQLPAQSLTFVVDLRRASEPAVGAPRRWRQTWGCGGAVVYQPGYEPRDYLRIFSQTFILRGSPYSSQL
jgi:hypothetical protein